MFPGHLTVQGLRASLRLFDCTKQYFSAYSVRAPCQLLDQGSESWKSSRR